MEETGYAQGSQESAGAADGRSCPHDLREWMAAIDGAGELKRIDAPVDLDEELTAITYIATRREDAAALLFTRLSAPAEGRVLMNLLGASKRS